METTSHPNLTPSNVLGKIAKLVRLTEKEGVEWSHWQLPIDNIAARLNFVEYLRMGCPKVNENGEIITNQPLDNSKLAHLILHEDFITPEKMADAYGFSYSNEQLKCFEETLPNRWILQRLQTNGFMLIARPPKEMSLLDIQYLDENLFYLKTRRWYADKSQRFLSKDRVSAGGWLAIRKGEIPNSFSKTWDEQQNLIAEDESVPNAPTIAFAVTAYYKVRGIYLFRDKYVRTSSVSIDGNNVVIGCFDKRGLDIQRHSSNSGCCWIGLSGLLKINSEESAE